MSGTVQAGLGYLVLAGTTGVLFIRYAVTGGAPAKHRGPRAPRRIEVMSEALLDELLGPHPGPVHGAAVAQAWRWCPSCCRNEPSVLHTDGGWTCGHCFEPTVPAAVAGGR